MRRWIQADELRIGDILPNPHLDGKPGIVVRITEAWYGVAISYKYDGYTCVSAVWSKRYIPVGHIAGIEVERD